MSFLSKIFSKSSGGVVDAVSNGLDNLFTSDEERMELDNEMQKAEMTYSIENRKLDQQDQKEFNNRVAQYEGTVKDLQQFGFLGKCVVFLRGMQRQIWGYGVLYLNYKIFSGQWDLLKKANEIGAESISVNLEPTFWIINFLVLGFLFGERAIQNILPLVVQFLNAKKNLGKA